MKGLSRRTGKIFEESCWTVVERQRRKSNRRNMRGLCNTCFVALNHDHGMQYLLNICLSVSRLSQFYSETILSRRGPLGKVWLAAHMERKLSKTQTLQTDIEQSVGQSVTFIFFYIHIIFAVRCYYGSGDRAHGSSSQRSAALRRRPYL